MPDAPRTEDLVHGVPPVSVSRTSTLVNRTGSWKYIRPLYRDLVAPCNEGCPVGIDIEGYMNLLREGRTDEALDLLLRENPMPATTGRVCYHPCESACNRDRYDGAVSIRAVERMLGDRSLDAPPPSPAPRTRTESVAVVGSGPAGLACAYHLARLGYRAVVFEADAEPGGVLRYGIPEYRLPKEILAREIERIRALGVELRCGVRLGTGVPWSEMDGFAAVFLATGAQRGRQAGIEAGGAGGILPGLEFLRRVNSGGRPALGERVVVVGGGNTAMDCARTALRLGSRVEVLYRRTQAEMPAIEEEVADARREGAEFTFLAAPSRAVRENGRLTGLTCVRMRLGEADESGRRRPAPVPGSEFLVPADTVLTAVGEEADLAALPDGLGDGLEALEPDGFGALPRVRFYAGGDLADQPRTVAHALGSGKRAAIGIDRMLRSGVARGTDGPEDEPAPLRFGPRGNLSAVRWTGDDPVVRHAAVNEIVPFEALNMDHFPRAMRHADRHLAPEAALDGFAEVNRGLDPAVAIAEARRCFNCGVCNLCELCLIFCPDLAITRTDGGGGFEIAYDYCKGCGLCSAECPRGAMAMTREGL